MYLLFGIKCIYTYYIHIYDIYIYIWEHMYRYIWLKHCTQFGQKNANGKIQATCAGNSCFGKGRVSLLES